MKKIKVRKHNDIIEACYNLSPSELRLLYCCISKIEYEAIVKDNDMFEIDAFEYAKNFNLSISNARRDMKKAVDRIWHQYIIIKTAGEDDCEIRWLSSKTVPKKDRFKNDVVKVRFSADIIPYLTKLNEKGNFTQIHLEHISELKSSYSIRLYELMVKLRKISPCQVEVKALREMFLLEDRYKTMKDFKRRVLDLAIKEINLHTDLKVSYENIKRGRSITAFNFTIKTKTKTKKRAAKLKHLSKKYIDENARPGETYEDAIKRLKNVLIEKQLEMKI